MRFRFCALALGLVGLVAAPAALACSRVLWVGGSEQVFVGRTQDWTEKADTTFRVYPRGIARTGAVTVNPLRWTTKYGSLVLSAYNMGTHEGVNDKGLIAHALSLAGEEVSFGKRGPRRPAIGVMQWVQYHLDNYATVAEAVAAQKNDAFQIVPLILPNGYPTLVHVSLSDKSGDSAVIEFIGGKPKIYHDKRFTVMTNEPTYDKQIENHKQYRTFGGDKPLLGERTPTDRFVRAADGIAGGEADLLAQRRCHQQAGAGQPLRLWHEQILRRPALTPPPAPSPPPRRSPPGPAPRSPRSDRS